MKNECGSKFYLFKKRGQTFIFDSLTCAQQRVTFEFFEKNCQEGVSEASLLVRPDISEFTHFLQDQEGAEPKRPPVNSNISHVSIFSTNACNLQCDYCYIGNSKIEISSSFVTDLIGFINNLETPVISINFTGGEPLIHPELIKEVVENCQEKVTKKRLVFSINTNATLVNDTLAEWFAKNNFLIMVGMDGEIGFESNKIDKRGKDNYEKILTGVRVLRNAGIEPSVRTTLTPSLKLEELYKHLMECGFNQAYIGIPAFQSCHDKCSNGCVSKEEFQKILSEYEGMYLEELDRFRTGQPTLFLKASQYLKKRANGVESHYYSCGAMKNSIAISVDGSIYPCQRFVGQEKFVIGNISDRLYVDQIESLLDQYDLVNRQCELCWARNICGRGCFWESASDAGFQQKKPTSCEIRQLAVETIIFLKEQITRAHADLS